MSSENNIFYEELKKELEHYKKQSLNLSKEAEKEFDKHAKRLAKYTLLLITAKTKEERIQYEKDIQQIKAGAGLSTAIKSVQTTNRIIEATWSIALRLVTRILTP